MGISKRRVLIACAAISAIMVLFPPVSLSYGAQISHRFVFNLFPYRIEFGVLFVQLMGVWFLSGMAYLILPKPMAVEALPTNNGNIALEPSNEHKNNFIADYWNGRKPLWKAYWLVGVLGSLGMGFVFALLTPAFGNNPKMPIILIGIPYMIWSYVAIFRSAKRSWNIWGIVAVVVMTLCAFLFLLGLAHN